MQPLTFFQRLTLILTAVVIQSIYFPASQAASGGIAPKIPLDVFPVIPIWVIPYYLTYALWLFALWWMLYRLDDRTFRAAAAGALFVTSIGALTFVFFPTYIVLPVLPGTDVFSSLLRAVQVAGGTHAALPSAHNYLTMLIAAFAIRLNPRGRVAWILILLAIALSTLFTGQHYLLDVVTGLALGWVGFRFGWWWVDRQKERHV